LAHFVPLSILLRTKLNQNFFFGSHKSEFLDKATNYHVVGFEVQAMLAIESPVFWDMMLLHIVQTGSGVHPTSYPMGTGGFFPGSKAEGS
jgi:hypothetical protein